ncbi:MAG: hypothetical protein U1E59_18035 [Amaricoccus sp.]
MEQSRRARLKTAWIAERLIATLLLCFGASGAAFADEPSPISINPSQLSYTTSLTVRNGTDAPVTFRRIANTCVPDAPETFTVGAGETWNATVTQKHSDDGLDNCYLTHHSIVYEDAANAGNTFGMQQYDNSDDPACFDLKIFVLVPVGQATCPVAQGSLSKPTSGIYFNPGSQVPQVGTTCPGDLSNCRAQVGRNQAFGFYISKPEAFSVTAVNGNSLVAMDCVLTDLAAVQDGNSCVSETGSVPPGGKASLSLAGSCGKFYRISDRTNVQLQCATPLHRLESGALSSNAQKWQSVSDGGSYTLPGD